MLRSPKDKVFGIAVEDLLLENVDLQIKIVLRMQLGFYIDLV